jgi:hypothetical protein
MIRHVVRRGDSLWGLAGQYLGAGARWPEIHKFHDEFALGGRHPQLLPIKDPNLIFVGQTIFIPPRSSKPYILSQGKPWPKVEVTKPATGLDLKVVYKIEDGQSQYKQVLPHCTLEAKLSGTIAIENMTHGRYRSNLELALSKDAPAVKQKLGQFSDHAFRDLTKGVELGYQGGHVTLKAPIMAQAGMGPYTIKVVAENPMKLKGSLKPETICATVDVQGRKYKYTADISFDVTVTLHTTPPKAVPEVAKETVPQTKPFDQPVLETNEKLVGSVIDKFMITLTILFLGTVMWQMRLAAALSSTTSMGPFPHPVDMNYPGNHIYYNRSI